jgi:hypothetical protein
LTPNHKHHGLPHRAHHKPAAGAGAAAEVVPAVVPLPFGLIQDLLWPNGMWFEHRFRTFRRVDI